MLHLHDIDASIEGVHVLRGVNLHLPPGATAALIGRNGAGKTTLLRTIMGFVRLTRGQIMLADQPLHTLPAHQRPELSQRSRGVTRSRVEPASGAASSS